MPPSKVRKASEHAEREVHRFKFRNGPLHCSSMPSTVSCLKLPPVSTMRCSGRGTAESLSTRAKTRSARQRGWDAEACEHFGSAHATATHLGMTCSEQWIFKRPDTHLIVLASLPWLRNSMRRQFRECVCKCDCTGIIFSVGVEQPCVVALGRLCMQPIHVRLAQLPPRGCCGSQACRRSPSGTSSPLRRL